MPKLPLPNHFGEGVTMSMDSTPGAHKSLLVREIREAKREVQRLASELSRLETLAVAAARRPGFDPPGFGTGTLKNKTKALNGWVFSLVESAITIDMIDETKPDTLLTQLNMQLADEFIAAIDQIKRNAIVFYRR